MRFKKATYWDLDAELLKTGEAFRAKLSTVDEKRIASGKDFDEQTGSLKNDKVLLLGEEQARALLGKIKSAKWKVESVDEKPFTARPSPPFITSTLQQEANRKLGLTSREAMRVAQSLYENGLITYMRTDSPNLSQEALQAARSEVESLYGKEYLSPEPRQFTGKRGAQEAHEAIRPAGSQFVHPKDAGLSGRDLALYELIWKRTMASQMADAKKLSLSVKISAGPAGFSANGTRILFPGFIRTYVEGSDDPEAALEDKEILLPKLAAGDELKLSDLKALTHETKPPARFTEALLVQTLEKEGVGRPSTYASIIDTIVDRGYVKKIANQLVPTFTGFAVTQFLEKHFEELVDPGFTSKMEDSLDEIAEGTLEWLPYLKTFYLGKSGLAEAVKSKEKKIDPEESRSIVVEHLTGIQIKVGRYGPYMIKDGPNGPAKKAAPTAKPAAKTEKAMKGEKAAKGEKTEKAKAAKDDTEDASLRASIPDDIAPADLTLAQVDDIIAMQAKGPQPIGQHPKTGQNVYCLLGRFGPYVQLGEVTEEVPKPRRASLLKGMDPKTISLEQALELLSLPRELGLHPTSQKPILASLGRFGPYVMHDGDFRSLKKEDNVFSVDLARAMELLSAEKKGRGGSKLVKDLGKDEKSGKPVGVYEGKYGPYVKMASVNATIPKDVKPEDITLEQALALIAARGKGKGKGKGKK